MQTDAAMIAEFLRRRGVTRCPTVCVAPTQGTVPEADRKALEARYNTRPSRDWIGRILDRK